MHVARPDLYGVWFTMQDRSDTSSLSDPGEFEMYGDRHPLGDADGMDPHQALDPIQQAAGLAYAYDANDPYRAGHAGVAQHVEVGMPYRTGGSKLPSPQVCRLLIKIQDQSGCCCLPAYSLPIA